jgi:hypothetical protein
MFASRVIDGAKNATARLTVRVGSRKFVITRALENLALVSFSVNGIPSENATEETYRIALADAFGIVDFANVVRLVDRLVFTFLENETALIWDTASQYEIFRALVLQQEDATRLRELEGMIVSADSAARNLNAVLYGIVKRQDKERTLQANAATVKAQLAHANADLAAAQETEARLQRANEVADVRRSDARTRLYKTERAMDDSEGMYEQAKFLVLNAALSKATPTQQYILLKLLSENECIACGAKANEAIAELEVRQSEGRCLICGSKRAPTKSTSASRGFERKARETYSALQAARAAFADSRREFSAAEDAYKESVASLQATREEVYRLERTTSRLIRKLPRKINLNCPGKKIA